MSHAVCLSDKALRRYLSNHPEIMEIVFCYDNDMDGILPDEPQETTMEQPSQHEPKPCIYHIDTSVHTLLLCGFKLPQIFSTGKENAGQFLLCVADLFMWTGVEVNLQPP